MKIVTDYDDGSNSDITTVLTTKSGYSELGKVAEKYLLRAVCISEDYINCFAKSKEYKCLSMTINQKT